MSDDLVKRLRLGACALEIDQAADRIEELEAKLVKAIEMLKAAGVMPIILAELEGETDA